MQESPQAESLTLHCLVIVFGMYHGPVLVHELQEIVDVRYHIVQGRVDVDDRTLVCTIVCIHCRWRCVKYPLGIIVVPACKHIQIIIGHGLAVQVSLPHLDIETSQCILEPVLRREEILLLHGGLRLHIKPFRAGCEKQERQEQYRCKYLSHNHTSLP